MAIVSRITQNGGLLISGELIEGGSKINFSQNGDLTVDCFEEGNGFSIGNITPDPWMANTPATIDELCTPIISNGHVYKCTTEGISGSTQPTWPTTNGVTVNDGTIVWTEAGLIIDGGGNDMEVIDFEEGVNLT